LLRGGFFSAIERERLAGVLGTGSVATLGRRILGVRTSIT
ncbi:MAG: hypothetical protein FD129_1159, partial [bacterium]